MPLTSTHWRELHMLTPGAPQHLLQTMVPVPMHLRNTCPCNYIVSAYGVFICGRSTNTSCGVGGFPLLTLRLHQLTSSHIVWRHLAGTGVRVLLVLLRDNPGLHAWTRSADNLRLWGIRRMQASASWPTCTAGADAGICRHTPVRGIHAVLVYRVPVTLPVTSPVRLVADSQKSSGTSP